MFKVLLLTFLLLGSFRAQALEIATDCSDLPMLQKAWETKYFYDFKFDKKTASDPIHLNCNSTPYKFVKALWFLENAKTSIDGEYYNKAKNLIKDMIIGGEPRGDLKRVKFLSEQQNACGAAGYENNIGQVVLYECAFKHPSVHNNLKKDYFFSLVRATVTILHEIRHLDLMDASVHVDCVGTGGVKGCDRSLVLDKKSAGSYSYEIIYLKDILQNNKFDPQLISAINAYIDNAYENNFN